MMPFAEKRKLGATDLIVSRIGIGCSYGVPTAALEEAFEKGINLFYFGTLRRSAMARAIQNISKNHRKELVVAIQSYARFPSLLSASVDLALRKLNLDFADILILGKTDKPIGEGMRDRVLELKESGKIRYLAVSAHQRKVFAEHLKPGIFDIFMTRYNAAHPGAEEEVFPLLKEVSVLPAIFCYTATRWGTLLHPVPGEKTPTALDCYRFVLTNPFVDVCFTGPKNTEEMRQALKILSAEPLTEEEMFWMRRVGAIVRNRKHHNFILNKLIFD